MAGNYFRGNAASNRGEKKAALGDQAKRTSGGGGNVEKSSHETGDVSTEAQLELLLDNGEQGISDFDSRRRGRK